MSYYRAALAAARNGDLSLSARLALIAAGEGETSSESLLKLLKRQDHIDIRLLARISELIEVGKFKKALRVRLPNNSRAYTIRGLIYACMGRLEKAEKAFLSALLMDTGNMAAKRALASLSLERGAGL